MAAIDCGSGMMRLLARGTHGREIQRVVSVPFAHAMASNDAFATLPDAVMNQGVAQVRQFVADSNDIGVNKVFMVCTAVFRRALNASQFTRRVLLECPGVTVCRVVSQAQESAFGYLTAVRAIDRAPTDGPVISLDVGGASFQLATPQANDVNDLHVFGGPHGSVTSLTVLSELRGTTVAAEPSPNPVRFVEVAPLAARLATVFPERPQWLVDALAAATPIVAIGDATSVFAIVARQVGHNDLTRDDVLQTLHATCGLSDAELTARQVVQPEVCVSKLSLLLAIFDSLLGATIVQYRETTGSCLGILEHFEQQEAAQAQAQQNNK
jgi:hypothetical protein